VSLVDKRTVYVVFGGTKIPSIFCSCMDAATKERCEMSDPIKADCKPYALVNSAYLADLESEVATLKAVCGKKDEALTTIKETHCNSLCAVLCDSVTCVGPSTGTCDVLKISRTIESALSLTPASVAEEAAHARIGRAVGDYIGLPRRKPWAEWAQGLEEVIAKAREDS
jgi:hypothetical protein